MDKLRVKVHNPEVEFARNLFHDIVKKFSLSLNNNAIFKAKLSYLTVDIHSTTASNSAGILVDERHFSYNYNIRLFYSLNDSKKWFAFIIAHELAHLSLIDINDFLFLSGEASDGSFLSTAIKRSYDAGQIYGNNFEECVCDYIAYFIVNQLNIEDENYTFERKISTPQKQLRIKFVEVFSRCFGDSMLEGKHIDEFDINGNSIIVFNNFWYNVTTFELHNIINIYDSIMGRGSYRTLNELVENLDENQEKIAELLSEFISKE